MPKRKPTKVPRKQRSRKKRKKRKRPYTRDKRAHRIRRRRMHHPTEHRKDVETQNYLLHQMLKTMSQPEGEYQYQPRHYTKDKEYKSSGNTMQQFKQGFPSPDTDFWRPPGPADSGTWTSAPYRGNIST